MSKNEQALSSVGFCVVDVDASHRHTAQPISLKYTMMALCLNGTASFEMNMEHMNLEAGMCVCYPHIMLMGSIQSSDDFKARILLIRDDMLLNSLVGVETSILQKVFTIPILLDKEKLQWKLVNHLLDCLSIESELVEQTKPTPANKQIMSHLLRGLFLSLVEHNNAISENELPPYTMADTYFRRFLQLIDTHLKQEHEVMFYAKKLNITPKYLNEISKNKTGHKAKEIISNILLIRIKNDIIMSGLSVKELSVAYGFADQSSMGKFFRKMTGMSPIQFRQHGMKHTSNP